jgi:hypothetical protein
VLTTNQRDLITTSTKRSIPVTRKRANLGMAITKAITAHMVDGIIATGGKINYSRA